MKSATPQRAALVGTADAQVVPGERAAPTTTATKDHGERAPGANRDLGQRLRAAIRVWPATTDRSSNERHGPAPIGRRFHAHAVVGPIGQRAFPGRPRVREVARRPLRRDGVKSAIDRPAAVEERLPARRRRPVSCRIELRAARRGIPATGRACRRSPSACRSRSSGDRWASPSSARSGTISRDARAIPEHRGRRAARGQRLPSLRRAVVFAEPA